MPLSDSEVGLSVRHGLAPQLYAHDARLRPQLEDRFQQNLKRSLLLTAELGRLLDVLPPALVFKGPALAQRLYGDVAGREYCDIDLLLRRSDIPSAVAALEKLGYSAHLRLEPWQMREHLGNGCEYAMSDGRVHVELHWQFAPRQFGAQFDIEKLFTRASRVRLGEREVRALSPEDDFLMLVVHGTKHAWAKLSWIADVAALLRLCDLDWKYVTAASRSMHVVRMMRVSLLLADWMGEPVPDSMRQAIDEDSESKAIAEELKEFVLDVEEPGKEDQPPHRLITATLDSASDRLAYAVRYALVPTLDDWKFIRLPAGLRWMYPAVRLLRLATRDVRD